MRSENIVTVLLDCYEFTSHMRQETFDLPVSKTGIIVILLTDTDSHIAGLLDFAVRASIKFFWLH